MKKIFSILLVYGISCSALYSQPLDYSQYHIIFYDNFDYPCGGYPCTDVLTTSPSTSGTVLGTHFSDNWDFYKSGYYDAVYFQPPNVTMPTPGIVRLTEKVESAIAYDQYPPRVCDHTSGAITSKIGFGYGIIEASIKLTNDFDGSDYIDAGGTLIHGFATTAFWTNYGVGGQYSEIDIVDASETNYLINRLVDYYTYPANVVTSYHTTIGSGHYLADGFHVYSCLWTPSTVSFYVDGAFIRSVPFDHVRIYPRLSDMIYYFTIAEQPLSGISPDGYYTEVDWVRVWELNCGHESYFVQDHLHLGEPNVTPGSYKYDMIESARLSPGHVVTESTNGTLFQGQSVTLNSNFLSDESSVVWGTTSTPDEDVAGLTVKKNGFFEIDAVKCKACDVNPITGPSIMCATDVFYYFGDVTPGGFWSSSNALVSINTSSGVISGIPHSAAPGTVTIFYTVGECTVQKTVSLVDCGEEGGGGEGEKNSSSPQKSDKIVNSSGLVQIFPNLTQNGDSTHKSTDNILNSSSSVQISPNPTRNNITISYSCKSDGKLLISMKDVSGRVRYEESVTCNERSNVQYIVDMSALDPGVYFIEVTLNNQHIVKKVVKL